MDAGVKMCEWPCGCALRIACGGTRASGWTPLITPSRGRTDMIRSRLMGSRRAVVLGFLSCVVLQR